MSIPSTTRLFNYNRPLNTTLFGFYTFPQDTLRHLEETTTSWYLGSSNHLHVHIIFRDSTSYRLKLIVKPDLNDTLRILNTPNPLII